MEIVQKPLRLDASLAALAEVEAANIGLSFNDLVVGLIEDFLKVKTASEVRLLRGLSSWLLDHYRPTSFPNDVTLLLFQHLRSSQTLLPLYEELIHGANGQPDPHQRQRLNQRIGAMVRRTLRAKVVGRFGPFTGELISTCAMLRPGT